MLAGCAKTAEHPLSFTGIVEATQLDLSAEIPGKVTSVEVRDGEAVTAGQALAVLDMTDYLFKRDMAAEALEISRLRVTELENGNSQNIIRQARENLAAASAMVTGAEKDLKFLELNYQDLLVLADSGAVSKREVDNALHAMDQATTNLQRLQSQKSALNAALREAIDNLSDEKLKMAELEVSLKQLELSQANQVLEKGVIRSPIDAVIQTVNYEPGEFVAPGQQVVTLSDLSHLWIKIYVPEKELYRVRRGMSAEVSEEFLLELGITGTVTYIASTAEFTPKNIESRENKQEMVYEVRVDIEDPSGRIKPGMFVDLLLREGEPE
jgi:HlyD family secretion protein